MSVATRLHFDASENKITAQRTQDVEDIIEHNKVLRSMPQKSDWGRHKWNLPNVIVEQFYKSYNGDGPPKPMNAEFWAYVDRKMDDPDYRAFRVDDASNPFFIGHRK